ncbi:hypothetical protein B484DRAFT_453444 [Ochromonadaceae sp. CCMP2298]|nr:hypothetical protein B484DRAFT_453444 [Ochromonadaceae sp. CCMP2298]
MARFLQAVLPRALLLLALVVLHSHRAAAFVTRPLLSSRILANSATQVMSSVGDAELTKIFGRIADKQLLLDIPGAGTPGMVNCCHGGCDNCDYSHVFDSMQSGRPKWVALYPTGDRQLIDGRAHTAPWSAIFEGQGVSQEAFAAKLSSLPYNACLGPPSSVPPDEPISETAVAELWAKVMGEDLGGLLTSNKMVTAMQTLTGEEHGATWKKFKEIFT